MVDGEWGMVDAWVRTGVVVALGGVLSVRGWKIAPVFLGVNTTRGVFGSVDQRDLARLALLGLLGHLFRRGHRRWFWLLCHRQCRIGRRLGSF